MSYNSNPEKAFNVVFERTTPMSDEETQDFPVLNSHAKTIIGDVTKQVLKKRFEKVRLEHQESKSPLNAKFSRLIDAVGNSNVQENRVTDRFVDDVERMMNCFNKDIGKLQMTYKNLMEKLPKVEST